MIEALQSCIVAGKERAFPDFCLDLLKILGYASEKRFDLTPDTGAAFLDAFARNKTPNHANLLLPEWQSVEFLFQLSDEEIASYSSEGFQGRFVFESAGVWNERIMESFLFFAIDLKAAHYTRTQLAVVTRELNKLFPMPVMVFFRHRDSFSLAIIDRRLNRRDSGKDVLEKVTLIKDIVFALPHRAHLEILKDLSLEAIQKEHECRNLVQLHAAWRKALDSSELNKRFFQEVANWYFWALEEATFPIPSETRDVAAYKAQSVIRLVTRLIFCWFLKEKGLIPDDLFNERKMIGNLVPAEDETGHYYKAILQNLFFATLNQEMDKRKFRNDGQNYNITNLYRYRRLFKDPDKALRLFEKIPFLNGGLFECLDKPARNDPSKVVRIDGFSDRDDNEVHVPDELFFGDERACDLNAAYGTKGKRYKTRGLIRVFERYKFTVTENTPIEEEIALDPELLGRVFENLLAAYNPETGATARKQTGSFYTPREVVDFMADEALASVLSRVVGEEQIDDVRHLLAYNDQPHRFSESHAARLVEAIDKLKILDPACGSGAFPMGILHKLVFVLRKLDPHNERWKQKQIDKAAEIPDVEARERAVAGIEDAFTKNELDYSRKLYLIENCIFGVDIQQIAVQIAKLRVFISLVVDQKPNPKLENLGIRPLPNLETRFVAANTLFWPARSSQQLLGNDEIYEIEKKLGEVRRRHFEARTPPTKAKWRDRDRELRQDLARALEDGCMSRDVARKLAGWDPYDQLASVDFFDPEWMFEIRDGFDIVIGNPPYVRQEEIKELKPALKERYSCFTGVADLYVYFFERGFSLLRQSGVLVFISSNKYFRAGYGEKLRGYLAREGRIRTLIDFGDAPVFTAIAYPSIIVVTRDGRRIKGEKARVLNWEAGPPIEEFPRVYAERSFDMEQVELKPDGWRLESRTVLRLLDKIRRAGTPLGEYVKGRFYRGILTGLNEAFVVDRETRDRLIAEHPSSEDVLKPFLRGRDVKRWRVEFANLWLIFTKRGIDINKYPAIKKHLTQFKKELMPGAPGGRKPGSYEWYEIQDNIAYWREFEQPKIVIPAITDDVNYAFDPEGFYSNDKTSICIADDPEYVLGFLNSKILWWVIKNEAATKQGGFIEFKPMYVSKLSIPEVKGGTMRQRLVECVSGLVPGKPTKGKGDPMTNETLIDSIVAHLYGLSEDEFSLILGETHVADPYRVAALNAFRDLARTAK